MRTTVLNYYLYHDAKLHLISHWAETPKGVTCQPNILQVAQSLDKIVDEVFNKAPIKFQVVKTPLKIESHMAGIARLDFVIDGDKLNLYFRLRKPKTETKEARSVFGMFQHLVGMTADFLQKGSDTASLEKNVTKDLV